jgi:hypothetical protein
MFKQTNQLLVGGGKPCFRFKDSAAAGSMPYINFIPTLNKKIFAQMCLEEKKRQKIGSIFVHVFIKIVFFKKIRNVGKKSGLPTRIHNWKRSLSSCPDPIEKYNL